MIKPYKLKNSTIIKERLSKAADLLGHPIDKGIFRSIVILNSIGFETNGSCEGHEELYNSNPYIDITFQTEKSDNAVKCKELFFNTLYKDLEDFYERRDTPHDYKIVFSVQNSSLSIFEVRLFVNTNLKVYGEKRELRVRNHYFELTDFCEFLNKKYKLNY